MDTALPAPPVPPSGTQVSERWRIPCSQEILTWPTATLLLYYELTRADCLYLSVTARCFGSSLTSECNLSIFTPILDIIANLCQIAPMMESCITLLFMCCSIPELNLQI